MRITSAPQRTRSLCNVFDSRLRLRAPLLLRPLFFMADAPFLPDASFLPGRVFSWSSPCPRAPRIIFGACQCNSGVMQVHHVLDHKVSSSSESLASQGHVFFQLFTVPVAEQASGAFVAVERWSEG